LPYVQSWNIGLQRELAANTVVEARYVGSLGSHVWRTYNLNEVNIFENGFLGEFRNAQKNLQINAANGRTGFANAGLPGQVPLPIFETAFGARGSQPGLPAGSAFTNGAFITNLQQDTAGTLANSLANNSQYLCRMLGSAFAPCARLGYDAQGPYPINFFMVNPYVAGAALNLVDDESWTKYHGLQLQLRRRFSDGFSLTANYTLSKNTGDIWADNATQTVSYRTLRNKELDGGPAPFDVRHVLQTFWTYELPFGGSHALKSSNGVVNAVIGGWSVSGVLSLQSGIPFRLSSGRSTVNAGDSGVILTGGLTLKDLKDMIRISPGPGFNQYFIDPKLIGPDGRANPQYLQVPTEPGQFGQFIYLYGKNVYNVDVSLSKTVPLPRRSQFTLWIGAFNVFNNPVWNVPTGQFPPADVNIQSTTFGQSTQPGNAARTMQVRGELRF
jgi:hypothetical protein